MAKILKSKRLKLAAKLKIAKCYIYSIFTYGCEAWTLSKVLEAENWSLRNVVPQNVRKCYVERQSYKWKCSHPSLRQKDSSWVTFKKKTQVFWPYQEKKNLDDSIRGNFGRQGTKRAAAEQLDGGHQGVDLPASLRLHQPSCRPRPVECQCTSTVKEVMTLPDTRYQKWHLLEQISIPLIQLQLQCESTLFNWITVKKLYTCKRALLLWWCCLKAFYWNISILLNFPGIASAPNLLFFWVNFEAGTLQSNAHILLSHDQPHSFFYLRTTKVLGMLWYQCWPVRTPD